MIEPQYHWPDVIFWCSLSAGFFALARIVHRYNKRSETTTEDRTESPALRDNYTREEFCQPCDTCIHRYMPAHNPLCQSCIHYHS